MVPLNKASWAGVTEEVLGNGAKTGVVRLKTCSEAALGAGWEGAVEVTWELVGLAVEEGNGVTAVALLVLLLRAVLAEPLLLLVLGGFTTLEAEDVAFLVVLLLVTLLLLLLFL